MHGRHKSKVFLKTFQTVMQTLVGRLKKNKKNKKNKGSKISRKINPQQQSPDIVCKLMLKNMNNFSYF